MGEEVGGWTDRVTVDDQNSVVRGVPITFEGLVPWLQE